MKLLKINIFQPLHRQLLGTLEIPKNAAMRERVEYLNNIQFVTLVRRGNTDWCWNILIKFFKHCKHDLK